MITGNTNPNPKARSSQFQSSKVGCPIRKSTDHRLFAPSRSLSQRTTSFFASYRQGIHQMLFGHLIALISNAHHTNRRTHSLGKEERLRSAAWPGPDALRASETEPNVRIAQKDQKSFRINPIQPAACAMNWRSSTSPACASDALGRHRRLRRCSGISPLYDVKFARHALARRRPPAD